MDPISVLGAVGSILGIMDVVTRSIKTLTEFQSRYATVSLKTRVLVGHLSTLNAALVQIKQLLPLVDADPSNGDDSQISADVAVSIGCCNEIMLFLDQRLSQVRMRIDQPTTLDKMGILWHESETTEFQTLLNNQVNAMNLLLSALQCKSLLEQRHFLEKPECRAVFSRIKDNTSSLLWLRDSDSELSRTSTMTERMSLVSARFSFDLDLFDSRAYRSAAMSTMRQALHGPTMTPQTIEAGSILANDTSETTLSIISNEEASAWGPIDYTIDYYQSVSNTDISIRGGMARRSLNLASFRIPTRQRSRTTSSITTRGSRRSSQWLSSTILHRLWGLDVFPASEGTPRTTAEQSHPYPRVLFLDSSKSGKSSALNAIILLAGPLTDAHIFHSKSSILITANNQLCRLLETGDQLSSNEPDTAQKWASLRAVSASVAERLNTVHTYPSEQQQEILVGISQDMRRMHAHIQEHHLLDKTSSSDEDDGLEYFVNAIDRITDSGYKPSFEDTMWCYTKSTGGIITRYFNRASQVLFCDIGGSRSERKKWPYFARGASKIFYFVDTGSYSQQLAEENAANRLEEERDLFTNVCLSEHFRHSEIVLFLHKLDKLERKLKGIPFTFAGFTGDPRSSYDVVCFLYDMFTLIAKRAGRAISVRFTTLARPEAFARTILSCALSG
ncbi:G-protein alpha subunit-domain-containing protein [Aspergillus recurvatus]